MSVAMMSLTEIVRDRIASRTGRRVRGLVVELTAGGDSIVLRGRADSFHVKQLAQQAVLETLPSAQLENAIIVE